MAGPPDDYQVRYGLDALAAIHTAAFQAEDECFPAPAVTVCFWVKAALGQGTQVIVNCGHRHAEEPGWSCFLHGNQLVASARGASSRAAVACPYPDDDCWHFVAVIFDTAHAAITATLDGDAAAWRASDIALRPEAPAGGHAGLTVGGYTDAAGGHFNYTFGRAGAGLLDELRVYARALTAAEIAGFAPPAGPAPCARFTSHAQEPDAPARVRFEALESGAGSICLWRWSDGEHAIGQSVERDFAYAGSYGVRLDVVDAGHRQATAERVLALGGVENPLRVTPVFTSGEGGYAAFRIPSIVRALNGDLVAFAEGRVESASDSTRTIRIVSKVSRDNGRTWGALRVVARNIVDGVEHAAMNASPVVDTVRGTGRIVLVFKKLESSEWEIAQGRGVMRTSCIFSDDHGQSWHGERDITAQVHRPAQIDAAADWRIQRPALGHAIQLQTGAQRGRLFHAGTLTRGEHSVFNSQNYVFWSDDLGETWQIGGIAPQLGLNEATAVELEDGAVMVNSRSYHDEQPTGRRAVTRAAFGDTGAVTFGDTRHDAALIDPAVQASIVRYTWRHETQYGGKSRIVFANPSHPRARKRMTVRLSADDGQSWAFAKVVDPGPAAYSDLVVQTDMQIGLLYERGNQGGIWYVSFTLDWLTDGQDTLRQQEGTG
ncbi:MAG: exo-alpha-sialidase [Caldilineaceae bacterium]|nr:exo-alpha-sialidase [Caldilineaceae bacterium]